MGAGAPPSVCFPLPASRSAGVALHISSLPSPHGIGDIGDAAHAFVDALVEMKLPVWQFLPTGPTAYGDSPYQPLSAFAGNTNLVGLEPLVRAGLLSQAELAPLRDLPVEHVDYGALIPRKGELLRLAASRFQRLAAPELKAAYDDFLEQHEQSWLADYAAYRVLKRRFGEQPWPRWPKDFVQRDTAAMAAFRAAETEALERVRIRQFFFDHQWQALKAHAGQNQVQLFGDMPIYIALDSADAWAQPGLLRVDPDGQPSHVAGVPPDYFSEAGQLWGNPLYDWDQHATDAYGWWVARVAHALRQADLLRIDHFRGFEAFWSVPFGEETARRGTWEPGPGDALFDALRAALGPLPIVAENLGVITPEVEALRRRQALPGMVVLQFAVDDPKFDPAAVAPHCVCYTGTHDNDTTVGWFNGDTDDTRSAGECERTRENALRLSGGAAATIHLDMIRLAFSSPAQLAVVPMQDFLGLDSRARLNTPGTTADNWQWRLLPAQFTSEFRRGVARLVTACARGQ